MSHNNVNRKAWIDCLRALAILLVIYRHVYGFTFDCSESADHTIIGTIFPLLALPLFFFISGFLSVKKPNYQRSLLYFSEKIKQRFVQLLIPTAIFYILLSNFVIKLPFPGGYWFTLVLLEMYIYIYI